MITYNDIYEELRHLRFFVHQLPTKIVLMADDASIININHFPLCSK
ncbi:MAG: hypothetical protein AABW47_04545 [Nanoarchaeota archaeon]